MTIGLNTHETRYYPKEFWVRVLPLAREHGAAKVATAFGISKQHLFKKIAPKFRG